MLLRSLLFCTQQTKWQMANRYIPTIQIALCSFWFGLESVSIWSQIAVFCVVCAHFLFPSLRLLARCSRLVALQFFILLFKTKTKMIDNAWGDEATLAFILFFFFMTSKIAAHLNWLSWILAGVFSFVLPSHSLSITNIQSEQREQRKLRGKMRYMGHSFWEHDPYCTTIQRADIKRNKTVFTKRNCFT